MSNDNDETPQQPSGNGVTHMFQITEGDLVELEKSVPFLLERAMASLDDNVSRRHMRVVKTILSNVRWNYGPWSDVTIISADDNPDTP